MTEFAAALSVHPDLRVALGETLGTIYETLGPGPDLVVLFLTERHLGSAESILRTVHQVLAPQTLIGAGAAGIVGGGQGVEHRAGLVIWAARLSTPPKAFVLDAAPGGGPGRPWNLELPAAGAPSSMLLLADPFGFRASEFLAQLELDHPAIEVFGGFASAGRSPGSNVLLADTLVHRSGAVGVLLSAADAPWSIVGDPTSELDLQAALLSHAGSAALLFTDLARGAAAFGASHHDAEILEDLLGQVPIAGMFGAGGFGPVGRRNEIHTGTAVVALFGET